MSLNFEPPLLNSASPWATTRADLEALYDCSHTGAVTVRTSLLLGWKHDETIHQYTFLESKSGHVEPSELEKADTSLNTLGYSPIDLHEYLDVIESIVTSRQSKIGKPFIISVTGTPEEIKECYSLISDRARKLNHRLLMEINLSCPNITNKPPPAYSTTALVEYLDAIAHMVDLETMQSVEVGIKAPPFTYIDQFRNVIQALLASRPTSRRCPINYIASTNTLGNCLVLGSDSLAPVLASESGEGLGGLGGAAIHPLSLGNVQKFRRMLDEHDGLRPIEIIGIGGVLDHAAFLRMKAAGASAVAVGTALGLNGVQAFERILSAP